MLIKQLTFFIITIGITLPAFTFGQKKGFDAGLLLGLSGSSINGEGIFESFTKLGITGGVFTKIDLSKKSSLQFEIRYIAKGTTGKSDYYGFILSQTAVLKCIELPLVLKFYDDHKTTSTEIGLAYANLFSYKQENIVPDNIKEPFFRNEFSFLIGLDYFIKNKRKKSTPYYLNFRYEFSIFSISEYRWFLPRTNTHPEGMYNRVFSITLNYILN